MLACEFDWAWRAPHDGRVGCRRALALPRPNTAAHRVVVAEGLTPRSLLVTGLASQELYQFHGGSF